MTNSLLTPADLGAMLGVTTKTLTEWRYRRYGPPSMKLGKAVRYRRDVVERWLAEQEATSGGDAA